MRSGRVIHLCFLNCLWSRLWCFYLWRLLFLKCVLWDTFLLLCPSETTSLASCVPSFHIFLMQIQASLSDILTFPPSTTEGSILKAWFPFLFSHSFHIPAWAPCPPPRPNEQTKGNKQTSRSVNDPVAKGVINEQSMFRTHLVGQSSQATSLHARPSSLLTSRWTQDSHPLPFTQQALHPSPGNWASVCLHVGSLVWEQMWMGFCSCWAPPAAHLSLMILPTPLTQWTNF